MKLIKIVFFNLILQIFSLSFVSAQPNDLMITYDANQGVSGLVGANKVYMYSGAVTSGPSGQWEWITGSVNLDDGVGLMTHLGNNVWTICIDPAVYYGTALPILAIDIIFRNEDGTAFGYDFNGTYTIINMTTPSPTSSFSGVTTGNCGVGITDESENETFISTFPNPSGNSVTISYRLPLNARKAVLNIFETSGKKVTGFDLNNSSKNIQNLQWNMEAESGSKLNPGVYYYSLTVDDKVVKSEKLIITR